MTSQTAPRATRGAVCVCDGRGGHAVRIATVIRGVLVVLSGLVAFVIVVGMLWIALGVVTVVVLSQNESLAWFNRPQY